MCQKYKSVVSLVILYDSFCMDVGFYSIAVFASGSFIAFITSGCEDKDSLKSENHCNPNGEKTMNLRKFPFKMLEVTPRELYKDKSTQLCTD